MATLRSLLATPFRFFACGGTVPEPPPRSRWGGDSGSGRRHALRCPGKRAESQLRHNVHPQQRFPRPLRHHNHRTTSQESRSNPTTMQHSEQPRVPATMQHPDTAQHLHDPRDVPAITQRPGVTQSPTITRHQPSRRIPATARHLGQRGPTARRRRSTPPVPKPVSASPPRSGCRQSTVGRSGSGSPGLAARSNPLAAARNLGTSVRR